jgi:hypothetical protein
MPQQVTCINKRGDHYDPHERINHIGGEGWRVSQEEGVKAVEADPLPTTSPPRAASPT